MKMSDLEEPIPKGSVPLPVDPKTGYPIGYGPGAGDRVPDAPPGYDDPVQPMPQSPVPPVAAAAPRPGGRPVFDTLGNDIPQKVLDAAANPQGGSQITAEDFYPDGLTKNMVDGWKDRFGKNCVHLVPIIDTAWVFRSLTRKEWGQLKGQNLDQERFEEQICLTCLLFPRIDLARLRAIPGGIATSLADYILKCSAFGITTVPIRL
jgi:hypothetical protein